MKNTLIKGLLISACFISVTSSASALTCTTLTKGLAKGSENSEVLKLQQYLYDSGYLVVKPNGYFGNGTIAAVKKFQSANGISQTGSVGPVTRGKVKEVSCVTPLSNNATSSLTMKKDVFAIYSLGKIKQEEKSNSKSKSSSWCLDRIFGERMSTLNDQYILTIEELKSLSACRDSIVDKNSQRYSDVNTILNAITRYSVDNNGVYPSNIIASTTEICAMDALSCADLVDLSVLYKNNKYLNSIPVDQKKVNKNGTGYTVTKNANGRITVSAMYPEGDLMVSVTR